MQAAIDAYLNAIPDGGWPDWVIGGHDKKRIASRIGPAQMRVLAMLLLTLKGTPFFFAGDEIGKTNVAIPPERIDDVFEKLVPGYGLNRDPERSPMAWDSSQNGGFTVGEPWLPMGDDVGRCNVLHQQEDPHSLLCLFRSLIGLRKSRRALTAGEYAPLRSRDDVLMFKRSFADERLLVALNFSAEPRNLQTSGKAKLLLSTRLDRAVEVMEKHSILRGNEGVVLEIGE